jgi:4-carboxymuconolactone decarboxylase
MNIFATLARHESLFWPWLAFAGKLLAGTLSTRHREIAILRTSYRCTCAYERRHHRDIAKGAGFRDDELDALERDPNDVAWEASDRVVIDVVDELHSQQRLSDATWQRTREHFSERKAIELVMLVGHYHMLAMTLNALQIEPEPDAPEAKPSSLVRAIQRVVLRGKQRSTRER